MSFKSGQTKRNCAIGCIVEAADRSNNDNSLEKVFWGDYSGVFPVVVFSVLIFRATVVVHLFPRVLQSWREWDGNRAN